MTEKMTNEELAYAAEMHAETNPACTEPMQGYLREIARRLRAMSWRPISEAPKDGTRIILAYRYASGSVVAEGWYRHKPTEGWTVSMDDDTSNLYVTPYAWMPLPQPPEPTDD